jgi:hypothetical protein
VLPGFLNSIWTLAWVFCSCLSAFCASCFAVFSGVRVASVIFQQTMVLLGRTDRFGHFYQRNLLQTNGCYVGNSTASFDSNFQLFRFDWMRASTVLALSGLMARNSLTICGQNLCSKLDLAQVGQRCTMVRCSRFMSTVVSSM